VTAAGNNTAFKIAAKPLQIDIVCHRPIDQLHRRQMSLTYHLATIHALRTDEDRKTTCISYVPKIPPNGRPKTASIKLCRFSRNLTYSTRSYISMQMCVYVFTFTNFSTISRKKYLRHVLGKYRIDVFALLYFAKIRGYMIVRGINVCGYRYIHGHPQKICGYGWEISYPRQAWLFLLLT